MSPSTELVRGGDTVLLVKEPVGSILFNLSGIEMMRIDPDGRFFVHGRHVETDREVYDGFREFVLKCAPSLSKTQ